MSLPHHVLLEYLTSRYPDEASAGRVLEELALPPPLPGSYQRIRSLVLDKSPRDVRSFFNGGSLPSLDVLWSWAQRQRFSGLWAREPAFVDRGFPDRANFEAAWGLLVIEAHRNVLDALLVQDARFRGERRQDIFDVMKTRFDIGISEPVLAIYVRYFFNMKWVHKADWIHYLRECDVTRREMLLLAMQTDDRARLRHRLGAAPRFSYPDVLADVLAESYFKFKDHASDSSPAKAKVWAKMLMDAGDRREKFKNQDIKDLRSDLQLEFEYLDMEFPSIVEVESGELDRDIRAAGGRPDPDDD
jgi:hypothetical protein